jgi:HAD superfamily hydrolase (TIGR01509 family)
MDLNKRKLRGIFFDLDGTIVDSKEAYVEAAKTAFALTEHRIVETSTALEIPKRLEQNLPLNDIVRGNLKGFLDVYLQTYYSVTKEKTKLIPNVANALVTLSQKAKLALITMRFVPKEAIIQELKHFGLANCFAYVVTALDTHKPKPSPEALIRCVKALDVQICDCAIVGDSVSDVRAGKAAGALTVAVLSGLFTLDELSKENPDFILQDASKLPKIIR